MGEERDLEMRKLDCKRLDKSPNLELLLQNGAVFVL